MSLLSFILSIFFIVGLYLNAFVGWKLLQVSEKRASNVESVLNSATFKRLETVEKTVNERMLHLTDTSLLLAKLLEERAKDGTGKPDTIR